MPQAQPNVPESENQDLRGIRPQGRGNQEDDLQDSRPAPESDKVRILSNDNKGNFLLEENLNKGEVPFKRNFVPESKQPATSRPSTKEPSTTLNTVSPALTKKPRTWPSSLKQSTVSVMERSKNGELTPELDDNRIIESTTFSTSEVHVSASTTAVPRSLEEMIRMMEQKMLEEKEKLRAANIDRLKIAKGEKLLTAIRENVAAREQIDDEAMTGKSWDDSPPMAKNGDKSPNSIDLQSASSDLDLGGAGGKKGGLKKEEKAIEVRKMARLRARRRKLTQRAKALAKALGDITEDEPYVVFPMYNVNTSYFGQMYDQNLKYFYTWCLR